MGRITKREFNKFVESPNGPTMLQHSYAYLYHTFSALWKEQLPYQLKDKLYMHTVTGDMSIYNFSVFCLFKFEMHGADPKRGHFSMYTSPKTHQVLSLIKMIEAEYPDECSEIQEYIIANKNVIIAEEEALINKQLGIIGIKND